MSKTEKFSVENTGFGFVVRFSERQFSLDYEQAKKFAMTLRSLLVRGGFDVKEYSILSTAFDAYAKPEEFVVTRNDVYAAWIVFKSFFKIG